MPVNNYNASVASSFGMQALSLSEIDQVSGGVRFGGLVIRVLDYFGRAQAAVAIAEALDVDLAGIGAHEQARRPGAGG